MTLLSNKRAAISLSLEVVEFVSVLDLSGMTRYFVYISATRILLQLRDGNWFMRVRLRFRLKPLQP